MSVKIDTEVFFRLWKQREIALGRELTINEVSNETGLAPETIRNIRDGKTTRFDAPVIDKLCEMLAIENGPVPFIVFNQNSD